jgi:hypothetical protein
VIAFIFLVKKLMYFPDLHALITSDMLLIFFS